MRLVEQVHRLLREHLHPGDHVIDATAGNGRDTLLLALAVGTEGRVLAIDRQEAAISNTRRRLAAAGLSGRVELRRGCHADILAERAEAAPGSVDAVVFNLGYLPGSDKVVRTGEATTRRALDAAAGLLRPGGLLTATAYRGHEGGPDEAAAVAERMQALEGEGWRIEPFGTGAPEMETAPILWAARKPGAIPSQPAGGTGFG